MKGWHLRTAMAGALALAATPAYAADHRDSPSVEADPTTDINDVYAFKSGASLVMVVTVNPFSGPVATEDFHFSTTAEYRIHVDSDGNVATDEKTYLFQFADVGSKQYVRVRGTGHGEGEDDDIIGRINTAHDGADAEPRIVTSDDHAVKVFAGPRDDPFFFSLLGGGATNYKGFTSCYGSTDKCFLGSCDRSTGGTGCLGAPQFGAYPTDVTDTFAGANVSAIVIEVPLTDFASSNLAIWASTEE